MNSNRNTNSFNNSKSNVKFNSLHKDRLNNSKNEYFKDIHKNSTDIDFNIYQFYNNVLNRDERSTNYKNTSKSITNELKFSNDFNVKTDFSNYKDKLPVIPNLKMKKNQKNQMYNSLGIFNNDTNKINQSQEALLLSKIYFEKNFMKSQLELSTSQNIGLYKPYHTADKKSDISQQNLFQTKNNIKGLVSKEDQEKSKNVSILSINSFSKMKIEDSNKIEMKKINNMHTSKENNPIQVIDNSISSFLKLKENLINTEEDKKNLTSRSGKENLLNINDIHSKEFHNNTIHSNSNLGSITAKLTNTDNIINKKVKFNGLNYKTHSSKILTEKLNQLNNENTDIDKEINKSVSKINLDLDESHYKKNEDDFVEKLSLNKIKEIKESKEYGSYDFHNDKNLTEMSILNNNLNANRKRYMSNVNIIQKPTNKGSLNFRNFRSTLKKNSKAFSSKFNIENLNKNKNNSFSNAQSFCPFCTHCNNFNDQNLNDYLNIISNAKNIINRGFAAILRSQIVNQNFNFDSLFDLNIQENKIDFRKSKVLEEPKEVSKSQLEKDLDDIVEKFPQDSTNNRSVSRVVASYLNALVEDKVSVEAILSSEVKEAFKNHLLSKGLFFNYEKTESDQITHNLINPSPTKHKNIISEISLEHRSSDEKDSSFENIQGKEKSDNDKDTITSKTKHKNRESLKEIMQNHEKSKSILLNDEQKFNIKKNAIFNFKEEINTNNTNTESKEKSISNEKLKNFLKSKEKKSENYDSKIAKSSKNDENFNTNNNDKIFDENNMKNSINSSNPKNKPTTKSLKVFVNDKLIEICDFELKIDPEIEENLDLLSRQKIKSILNKKYVKQVIIKDQFSESSINHETKSLFLFNIFLQVLAEINIKDKEKSFMLYKFFKIYFAQQNKKYGLILSKLNEKVKFYKDLCMLIVQQKHRQIENIEVIAEILSTGKLNEENLTNHKKLIKDLLVINNEKREELYLKNSEIEILTKELRFFIHDFDNIKLDKKIRLNLTDIKKNELESIKKNINNELSHLPMSIDRSLLINADIFMFLSGHRKYFYEQKEYYLREVEKLREKVHLATSDKKTYLEQYNILKYESNKKINDLNEQIREYRENIFKEKKQTSVQTDIDLKEFGKIEHHHFSFVNKKNEVLKISILADYMDTVIYTTRAISNHKSLFQMSITSILNFISEVYENKLINDIDNDLNRKVRMNLDDYLYYYMKSIFQHKDHIKDNMEKFIYSIYNVFSSDVRIYYFSRFTGMLEYKFINQIDFKEQKTDSDNNLNHNSNNNIKENTKGWNTSLITNDFSNIKREVLDAYLMIISSFSFPICKVIDLEIDEYLISVESCVNILNSFKHLNLLNFEFLKMSISSKNSDLYKICKQLNIPLSDDISERNRRNLDPSLKRNDDIDTGKKVIDSNVNEFLIKALFSRVRVYDYFSSEETYNYFSFKEVLEVYILHITIKKFPLPLEIDNFSWETFIENIFLAHIGFNLTKEQILSILLKYFKKKESEGLARQSILEKKGESKSNNSEKIFTHNKVYLEYLSVETIYIFAKNHKSFKINLSYFIYTLLSFIERKYKYLEKKIDAIFDKYDNSKLGLLKLSRMEDAMHYILSKSKKVLQEEKKKTMDKYINSNLNIQFDQENEKTFWRISNFIVSKYGTNYNDFVTKSQFISYIFDDPNMLNSVDGI